MLTTWSPQQFILNHPVNISLTLLVLAEILIIKFFRRQLGGSLHMEVSIALLNLLGAVSLCKGFL